MNAARIAEVLATTDDETKIAVVSWAFKHLVEHAMHGGTLRQFTYDRLKLPMAAYTPLMSAGGMTIVSRFELMGKEPTAETCRVPVKLDNKLISAGVSAYMKGHKAADCDVVNVVCNIFEAVLLAHKADAEARR